MSEKWVPCWACDGGPVGNDGSICFECDGAGGHHEPFGILTDDEYKHQFIEQVINRALVSEEIALMVFDTISIEEWRKFDEDPEAAADIELDEWTNDG